MAEDSKLFSFSDKQNMLLQRNSAQQEKIYEELTKKHKRMLDKQEQDIVSYSDKVRAINTQIAEAKLRSDEESLQKATQLLNIELKNKKTAEKKLEAEKKKLKQEALKAAEVYELSRYSILSSKKKKQYQEEIKQELSAQLEKQRAIHAQHETQLKEAKLNLAKLESEGASSKDINKARKTLQDIEAKEMLSRDSVQATEATLEQTERLISALSTKQDKATAAVEAYNDAQDELIRKKEEFATEEAKLADQVKNAKNKSDKEAAKKALKELKEKNNSELNSLKQLTNAALTAADSAQDAAKKEKTLKEKREEALKAFSNVTNAASNAVDESLKALYGNQGKMMGRLQGTGFDWQDAVKTVSANVGFSGAVSQQKVVQKMVELVDSGVAYNLELRGFLAETSESIASTFNAFDSNLLRLIRLQQADTTAARLGLEAKLTQLFNEYFEDSSYLAQDVSAAVSEAILDANASLSRDESLEFEYMVQKWLGSLYSLGLSQTGATTIAQGINKLASGDYAGLTENTALMNLFSLSASRAGYSIESLLTGQIGAVETNKLLKSMVEYLAEIANSTDKVTKSAYANLFDMSVTDLKTFASLTTSEIESLYSKNESFSSLQEETNKQLSDIKYRKNISELIDTVIENAMTGTAQTIGSDGVTYGLWKSLNLVQSLVDLEIPGITALGTGTTSGIKPLEVAKAAFVGMGLVSSLGKAVASGTSLGMSKIEDWNSELSTKRGSTLPTLASGVTKTVSYSATLGTGSASASDIQATSFQSAQDTASEANGVSSADIEEQKEIPQKILDALVEGSEPTVVSLLSDLLDISENIDANLDKSRVFYTAIVGASKSNLVDEASVLSTEVSTLGKIGGESSSVGTEQTTGNAIANAIKDTLSGLTNNASKDTELYGMSEILQEAVEAALRSVLGSYSAAAGNSLSVSVIGGIT